jgi:hypothetical protein
MGILAIKILGIWSVLALVTGLAIGAIIQKGERLRQDEFLTFLFSMIASLQAPR